MQPAASMALNTMPQKYNVTCTMFPQNKMLPKCNAPRTPCRQNSISPELCPPPHHMRGQPGAGMCLSRGQRGEGNEIPDT